jgi:hypothetical protein
MGEQTNSAGCMGRVRGRGDPGPAMRDYPRSTSKAVNGNPDMGPRAVEDRREFVAAGIA